MKQQALSLEKLWQWQAEYVPSHYLLACSGGKDSIAMLSCLATEQDSLKRHYLSFILIMVGIHLLYSGANGLPK